MAVECAGCRPGGVRNNGSFLAIKRDLELRHKPGDAALVAAFHGDDIGAGGEHLGNVSAVIAVPVVSGERGFAVHEQGEAVITGGLQLGRLNFAGRQFDYLPKINSFIFLRAIRPNPLRGLRGEGASDWGNEKEDEKDSFQNLQNGLTGNVRQQFRRGKLFMGLRQWLVCALVGA